MNKKNQPKIDLEVSSYDSYLDRIGWMLVLVFFIYVTYWFYRLPDIIPVHINYKGEVDNYSSKIMLYILPMLTLVFNVLFTIVNRYPHSFNYLVKITPDNAARQYSIATRSLRYLKIALTTIFFVITYSLVQLAVSETFPPIQYLITLVVIIVMLPLVQMFYQSLKNEK